MAGYWPSSLCVFIARSIDSQKKNEETEQAWSIKDSLYMAFGEIFLAGHGG